MEEQRMWKYLRASDMSEESDEEGTLVVHKPDYRSTGMCQACNYFIQDNGVSHCAYDTSECTMLLAQTWSPSQQSWTGGLMLEPGSQGCQE